jgi:RNA polymerase sigma factor (sigma-70 family)
VIIDEEREANLAARARKKKIIEERARYFAHRYPGVVREVDTLEAGNFALAAIVRSFPADNDIGAFDDYCRRKIDRAMADSSRVDQRRHRLDRAAIRASAELLARYRGEPGLAPEARIDRLAEDVLAGSLVAVSEEAAHLRDVDPAERELYVKAHAVVKATLATLPRSQQRTMALLYVSQKTQEEAAGEIGVHVNTVHRWHKHAVTALHRALVREGIVTRPGRAGGPPLVVLPDPEDEGEHDDGEGDGEDEGKG